jgi:hypothetical protein
MGRRCPADIAAASMERTTNIGPKGIRSGLGTEDGDGRGSPVEAQR